MPTTLEIVCENDDCELDMAELHYTYDMPEDVTVADFQCPYCCQSDSSERSNSNGDGISTDPWPPRS